MQSQSFNTAASFVTNTNWQSYSGENALGYVVQMAGLAVQNFVSAAVGIAVAIALVRGFTRNRTDRLGNFWVDLTRICLRILLPISIVFAIIFVGAGMIQNFHDYADDPHDRRRHADAARRPVRQPGGHQGTRHQRRRLVQRQLRAPVREPDDLDELARDLPAAVHLVLAAAHVRRDGRRQAPGPRDRRRDGAAGDRRRRCCMTGAQSAHHGTVPTAVGAATEGTEQRFGVPDSAIFATGTTLTSTGAVDSFHDSYTSLGGAMTLFDMMLGEVAPGGTGSGLYGMLDPRRPHRLRRRADGRANTGVPRQETRRPGGEVRLALPADHAGTRTGRHRRRDGLAR